MSHQGWQDVGVVEIEGRIFKTQRTRAGRKNVDWRRSGIRMGSVTWSIYLEQKVCEGEDKVIISSRKAVEDLVGQNKVAGIYYTAFLCCCYQIEVKCKFVKAIICIITWVYRSRICKASDSNMVLSHISRFFPPPSL